MNLKELHSFQLSDAIAFHDELNPKLWNNNNLRPEVKKQLEIVAQDFLSELGVDNLDVQDITVSGSNAAYSYTPHSDLDLHILVDMSKLDNNEVYKELFNAKKNIYNDTHNILIHGVPVELYVQDAREPVVSLGEYSIKDNKWLRLPTKRRANFDQNATKAKYEKLLELIQHSLGTRNLDKVQKTIKKIKQYRQAGLDKGGEFGPENLAYKALRNQGFITKLYDLKDKLHSEVLTIETMYQDPVKIQEEKNKLPPKVYHLTYTKNLPDIMQAGLRPQIGDRSSKVEGEHPAVFCFPDIATLEDAMMNWLGDEFDEDEQLALLEIDTRNLTGEFTPNAEYEVAITSMIPPSRIKVLSKDFDTLEEDYDPNGTPPGPEFKPTMPAGTVRVDVSDVYDWYKLGKNISDLSRADPNDFGKGPPSTIMAFGSEPEEHKYIAALKKLGLTTTDIDPLDPNQPKGMPRQSVDPTYNVDEARTNPEQNYKFGSGKFELAAFAEDIRDKSNWGVSMTLLPKLGINPKPGVSEDTPKGIYFYPLDYFLSMVKNKKRLPWGDHLEYMQLFQYDNSHMMTPDTKVPFEDMKRALNEYGVTDRDIQYTIDEPGMSSRGGINNPLWFIYDALSKRFTDDERRIIVWNKILRNLGFTVLLDNGKSWIAFGEPYQGCVLDIRAIKQNKTFTNYVQGDKLSMKQLSDAVYWSTTHLKAATNVRQQLSSQVAKEMLSQYLGMSPQEAKQKGFDEAVKQAVNKVAELASQNSLTESEEDEIHNYPKLDHILAKLCKLVIKGQNSDKDYGMVAACVIDPDNNVVTGLNIAGPDGKRVHAERVAIEKYEREYGNVPEGSIIVTTLSPCNEQHDETAEERLGESCTDFINSKDIEKVYCGYIDPTQDNNNREFNIMETSNKELRAICKTFADTFLSEDDTMQFAAEKTAAVSPYAGLKDVQFRGSVSEASGYIPSEKEKNDPRFKTALTVDVHPDSIKKNAKAFYWKTNRAGIPPTAKASGKI